ncbi:ArsR/SmtB family transcription factor [Levilactobacillus namurensis]|uniref:ArsR/SmtB family transcription factor n=1 Tax=Levilactobacillus namurensis TaxID=380393 RepID=UPI00046385A7|nr:helix-turn-helix domain-containing protein [Levilactobacillus namurensis]
MVQNKHYVQVNRKALPLFKALASDSRLAIIEMLQKNNLSIQSLSQRLGISSAMVTKHITILERAGLVDSIAEKGVRGRLKICCLKKDDLSLIFNANKEVFRENTIEKQLPIGSFYDYNVQAPCGLATAKRIIGYVDNPQVFDYQNKDAIKLIWFAQGFLAYHIPTYDVDLQNVTALELSLEVCAEYAGYRLHSPSQIDFQFNHQLVGSYTSPGDFGDRPGCLTPDWWQLGTQYGRRITLRLDQQGTFIDEAPVSAVTLPQILAHATASHRLDFTVGTAPHQTTGGLNLFGDKFGDFAQDIQVVFTLK